MGKKGVSDMRRGHLFCLFWILLLAGSCVEVELCDESHSHYAMLDFRFHWQKEYEENRPDSMWVVAIRPVNLLRYKFRVTSENEGNKGVLLYPLEEKEPLDMNWNSDNPSLKTLLPKNDKLRVKSGEYNFAAYGWDGVVMSAEADILDEEGNEMQEGSGLSLKYLSYKHYPVNSPEVTGRFGEWKDYNAYSDYISECSSRVYIAFTEHIDMPLYRNGGMPTVQVDLTPIPVTQDITFVFNVDKAEGVVIDSIVAEISGVPSTLEITTGAVQSGTTYKMLFVPTYGPLATEADSLSVARLRCEGKVSVSGIVSSYSPDMVTGPGILQTAFYTHGLDEKGKRCVKVFHAGINLYHTFKEKKLLDWDDEKKCYWQTCTEAVIEILPILQVDKDKLQQEGSSATGLDFWIPGETINVDVH